MDWKNLHSNKRLGADNSISNPEYSHRNEYLRDYDRLIFSSPFRRLQNKTQVFPLPKHIFVHNRLTHSLEVASVGRSLGQMVGEQLLAKYNNEDDSFKEFYKYEFSTVIATACLAHDIGNPPFGHSGEEAIRTFFENLTGKNKEIFEKELTENQQKDFLKFEGNANAFRLLTHDRLGIHRMCFTTLASIVKYPTTSEAGFDKTTGKVSTKKSGFFDAEINKYKEVANALGIKPLNENINIYPRHPFVFLMEAADDICYRIIDLEDAFRLKILSKDQVFDLLLNVFEEELSNKVKISLAKQSHENQQLSYLRAMLINYLVECCAKVFIDNEAALLAGNLNQSLIDILPEKQKQAIKEIDRISIQQIYNHKSVVEIELAGYTVIGGLLAEFVEAINFPKKAISEKLLALVPSQFETYGDSYYFKLLSIVDFISGMTDLYAVDLFRKLKGIEV